MRILIDGEEAAFSPNPLIQDKIIEFCTLHGHEKEIKDEMATVKEQILGFCEELDCDEPKSIELIHKDHKLIVSYAETLKLVDVAELESKVGERFHDLVKVKVSYTSEPKLKEEYINDPELFGNCLEIVNTPKISVGKK